MTNTPDLPSRAFLYMLARMSRRKPKSRARPLTPAARLALIRATTGRPSAPQWLSSLRVASVREVSVPGAEGPIAARLYRPRGLLRAGRRDALVIFLHGGGFVHCDLVSHHGVCCRLAQASGARVLSVGYRLAPEHPFPAGVEDCVSVLEWLARTRPNLRLAVCGDSAGGNLAAVLAHHARDHGIELAAQVLFYPVLYGAEVLPSRLRLGRGYLLTQDAIDWYAEAYLPDTAFGRDPRFAPGLIEDLSGLAPACVVTAGFDPLVDEGEAYAARLAEAGVPTLLKRYPRAIHGFVQFYPLMPNGGRAIRLAGQFLRRWFRAAPSELSDVRQEEARPGRILPKA